MFHVQLSRVLGVISECVDIKGYGHGSSLCVNNYGIIALLSFHVAGYVR